MPGRGRVHVYTVGLVYQSACAPSDMTPEEMLADVNEHWPTGLDHPWRISEEPTFSEGQSNPCPCDQDRTRTHYLLAC